jgi:hypothetical protein
MVEPYLTGVKPLHIFCLTGACKRQRSELVRQFCGGFNWDSTPLLWPPLQCPERSMRISGNELFHTPYNATFQTNLDPMWMCGGFRENILDDAFRKFSGSLILFLYNLNTRSRFDVRPDDSIHLYRL